MATLGTKTARERPGPMKSIVFHMPKETDKRVKVEPPTYHIGNGDSPRVIRFDNQTGDSVRVWLPNADKYLSHRRHGSDFSKPFEVPIGGVLELTVKANPELPEEGEYQYHVYCEAINGFAEGNSPPVLHCP
jgi:hypothetical protein